MTRPVYCRNEDKFADHGCYDPLLVTKLIYNYRAHPALLQLPSAVFYHNELVASADRNVTDCLVDWEMLPNKDHFPVIFHGVKGEDLREGDSPSWFNPVEAMQVMKYVQALRTRKPTAVKTENIGVITPYRKQVEKIRLMFSRLGMEGMKVGSVEEFQGQERIAIIVSTVRSCDSYVDSDVSHNIGFLSNPKRFNVTITRAQSLLIVIGNPHVLAQDPYWCSLLRYCVKNQGYIGCDLPPLDCLPQDEDFRDILDRTGLSGNCQEWDKLSGMEYLRNLSCDVAKKQVEENHTHKYNGYVELNTSANKNGNIAQRCGEETETNAQNMEEQDAVKQKKLQRSHICEKLKDSVDMDNEQKSQIESYRDLVSPPNTVTFKTVVQEEKNVLNKLDENFLGTTKVARMMQEELDMKEMHLESEHERISDNDKSSVSEDELEEILLVPQI